MTQDTPSAPQPAPKKPGRGRFFLALGLMVGPAVMIVLSIISLLVLSLTTELLGVRPPDLAKPIVWAISAMRLLGLLLFIPGLIAGVILLATRKKTP